MCPQADYEARMLLNLKIFFNKLGYETFTHKSIAFMNGKTKVDLYAKRAEEALIVELSSDGRIERQLALLGYLRKKIKMTLYLALPKGVQLTDFQRTRILENQIIVIWVGHDWVDITIEKERIGDHVYPLSGIRKRSFTYFEGKSQLENVLNFERSSKEFKDQGEREAKFVAKIAFLKQAKIPEGFLTKIKYNSIAYSIELNKFASDYQNLESEQQEYELILENLKQLWAGKFQKAESAKAFEDFKIFEPILKNLQGYRDHFIHPFQVLLLGSLIIDKNYDMFQDLIKKKLPNSKYNSLDFSWLMASTFHDFCYPIEYFGNFTTDFFQKFLNSKEVKPQINLNKFLLEGSTLKYIDQLVALYGFFSSKDAITWIYDEKCALNNKFRSILL
jgi:hypothetical protein